MAWEKHEHKDTANQTLLRSRSAPVRVEKDKCAHSDILILLVALFIITASRTRTSLKLSRTAVMSSFGVPEARGVDCSWRYLQGIAIYTVREESFGGRRYHARVAEANISRRKVHICSCKYLCLRPQTCTLRRDNFTFPPARTGNSFAPVFAATNIRSCQRAEFRI